MIDIPPPNPEVFRYPTVWIIAGGLALATFGRRAFRIGRDVIGPWLSKVI
jgi:hypothetical protein